MSDYTKSTNFASKDSLLSGNPLKIVKGTEIDTEFNNIATAIATKADLASPALTGTPTAPTAAPGTNSTQIATTAFAIQAAYPIGSIYMNISNGTNPATLLGFGTWVALEGVAVYGRSSTDATFGTAGATGGSKDAIVVSHTHTAVAVGDHTHYTSGVTGTGTAAGTGAGFLTSGATENSSSAAGAHTHTINSTGSSGTNANLPPYIVAYMWKRTA